MRVYTALVALVIGLALMGGAYLLATRLGLPWWTWF